MMRLMRARRAFTLLEVVVAASIFALVIASLYVSFRTGVRAYDIGATHSEGDQTARYVISQLSDDLRNVFYKTEDSYNIGRKQREQILEQQQQQELQSGGVVQAADEANLPELGPAIDLGFVATDGGESDEISFVRLQDEGRTEDRMMWGLARLRYFVSEGAMYRSIDDVKMGETDEEGNEIPKPYPPQVDKVANHVKGIDLQFGYFHEGEWKLAPDWDSAQNRYRNPLSEEDEEEYLETTAVGGESSSPESMKPDDLPAWVEISITFSDPKKEEKEKIYRQIVQIPAAQETYVPPEEEDPNDRTYGNRSSRRRTR